MKKTLLVSLLLIVSSSFTNVYAVDKQATKEIVIKMDNIHKLIGQINKVRELMTKNNIKPQTNAEMLVNIAMLCPKTFTYTVASTDLDTLQESITCSY